MRYNDLNSAGFLDILNAAWATFQLVCERAKTEAFNPFVVVARPGHPQLLVLSPPHGAVPELLKVLVGASASVPMLCTEMWRPLSDVADDVPSGPVAEPGAESHVAVMAQFVDGVITITGRLSHHEPVPGVVRSVSNVEVIGVLATDIGGRMIASHRDPLWQ